MKQTIVVYMLCFLALLAGNAWATQAVYQDSSLVAGDTITYTLDYNLLSGSTYTATFSMANSANVTPEWYAGYVLFKFDGPTPGTITNISDPTNGTWSSGSTSNNANILQAGGQYNAFAQDGFYGFYENTLVQGQTFYEPNLVLLTGSPTTSTFTFNFTANGPINFPDIPFQVGYYDGPAGQSGNYKFNQLSADLHVPEPSILLFLGLGLVVVAGAGRKFKK
jgi:hypothetical protein